MNAPRRPYRRIIVPLVLAIALAAESIAVVFAVDRGAANNDVVAAPAVEVNAFPAASIASLIASAVGAFDRLDAVGPLSQAAADLATASRPSAARLTTAKMQPKPVPAKVRTPSANTSTGSTGSASYTGRNRMWFPALGINRSVSFFSCTSKAYPGDVVYRWGCAGANNVYLFGHAHSVFKPLHDAYVRGRLAKGMKVTYADANGKVRTYAIAWWKVVAPDKGAFAYAAQSRPSMTLQTCVGSNSQYRLIVRLVQV
jgi:hypothetical protein